MPFELGEEKEPKFEEIRQKFDEQADITDIPDLESEESAEQRRKEKEKKSTKSRNKNTDSKTKWLVDYQFL